MTGLSLCRSLFASTVFWVLNISFWHGAAGHLKRNPSQGNQTPISLTNLTPEELNFNSFTLDRALYNPSRTYISLPSSCSSHSKGGGKCPTEMRAVNVTYDDCWDSWTLCHCSSANMTLDDSISRLGRVPVGLRKYIATTHVFPADESHAYTLTNGDIYFFGDLNTDTWVHEATHAYDYAFGDPYSGSQKWLNAIGNDTCGTDVYGITNAAEELAQSSVLKIFSLIYGSLPPGWNADCMSHQQGALGTLPLYDKTTLFADTCASNSRITAVRPIKSNGPSPNSSAPLRMDPGAASSTVLLPEVVPQSVANDPHLKKNSASSQFFSSGNMWLPGSLSLIILLIL